MNEELANLIKEKIKEGRNKEEIKNLLLSHGWSTEEIEQSFPAPPEGSLAFPGVIFILRETLLIYRKKIITILGISLVPLIAGLILNFLLNFLSDKNLLTINISDSF
ncbi:MAG: hypothetical protein NTU58_03095 [Candidatus Nealsonbacteria bacterium]|nr:hypothetical protein [Candidatus Nealsonbacteria bacterium]